MKNEPTAKKEIECPIWQKLTLTIDEAAVYSGIGRSKLYELTSQEDCPFVLRIGSRRVIKRRLFDEFIDQLSSF